MKFSNRSEAVNAGSMADIAFLLLIFFLVTTSIPNDEGIQRKLPRECKNPPCDADVKERNIFSIAINKNNEILVQGELLNVTDLKKHTMAFLDNNGEGNCNYCSGLRAVDASVHPEKAVISLLSDRETSYKHFITVQNELNAAYKELRENYARKYFKKPLAALNKTQLDEVENAYPKIISEAEIK